MDGSSSPKSNAESSRKTSISKINSKKATNSSSSSMPGKNKKKYNFDKLKLGMTKKEVISIMGKPSDKSPNTLNYGDDDLDFDNNQTLSDGSPTNIHKAAMARDKAEAKAARKEKENNEDLRSYAKIFGQEDVETLQKYVGVNYSAIETSKGMEYGYKTPAGMLYRLDDSSTGITHVYKEGKDGAMIQLYVGQTIKQKQHRYYY